MADRIVVMQKDPGRVVTELQVSLPHPRQRKATAFVEMVARVYATLAGKRSLSTSRWGARRASPDRSGRSRTTTITALAGLLEHVANKPGDRPTSTGLPRSWGGLRHLLGLTEAAELLGFATVTGGDIALTPLGETFAERASWPERDLRHPDAAPPVCSGGFWPCSRRATTSGWSETWRTRRWSLTSGGDRRAAARDPRQLGAVHRAARVRRHARFLLPRASRRGDDDWGTVGPR